MKYLKDRPLESDDYFRFGVEFGRDCDTGKLVPHYISIAGAFWPMMPRYLGERELNLENSLLGIDFTVECAFGMSTSPLPGLKDFDVDVAVLCSTLHRAARLYHGIEDDDPCWYCEIEIVPPDGETEYWREPYESVSDDDEAPGSVEWRS